MSTISLLISLKPPRLPQEHLVGSRNFFSIWRTERTVPQEGHSNLALTTCGLTSLACLIIPSMTINSLIFLERRFLTLISWLFGKLRSLTRAFSINPDSSIAISRTLRFSSGFASISSVNLFEYSKSFMKSTRIAFFPFLKDSPSSFL